MMDFSWSLSMMVFQSAPCNLKIRRIVFHSQDLFNYPVANNPLFCKNTKVNCKIIADLTLIFWLSLSNFVRVSFRFRKCQNKKECMLSLNCWMWAEKNKTEFKPKLLELFLFNQIVSRKKQKKFKLCLIVFHLEKSSFLLA